MQKLRYMDMIKVFGLLKSFALMMLTISGAFSKKRIKRMGASTTDSNCYGDICPGNICPYQKYLSCYWPDFDETLKVDSWEHIEQIPTIKLTYVKATFVLVTSVHIRNISPVTDPIWWNFKGSFLGTYRTDSNYQNGICPGNFCPGNICPNCEYFSCYWPNFN